MGIEALKGDGGVETSAPVDERERARVAPNEGREGGRPDREGKERKEGRKRHLALRLHPSLSSGQWTLDLDFETPT